MDRAPDCGRSAGVLKRAIGMVAHDGEVRASLEDDYHHFRVKVRHDGKVVTGVESESVRFPWGGCAMAGDDWSKFVGAPLEVRSSAIARYGACGDLSDRSNFLYLIYTNLHARMGT